VFCWLESLLIYHIYHICHLFVEVITLSRFCTAVPNQTSYWYWCEGLPNSLHEAVWYGLVLSNPGSINSELSLFRISAEAKHEVAMCRKLSTHVDGRQVEGQVCADQERAWAEIIACHEDMKAWSQSSKEGQTHTMKSFLMTVQNIIVSGNIFVCKFKFYCTFLRKIYSTRILGHSVLLILVAKLGTKVLPLHTYIHTDYTQTLAPFRLDILFW
jgi:hypothetical protein